MKKVLISLFCILLFTGCNNSIKTYVGSDMENGTIAIITKNGNKIVNVFIDQGTGYRKPCNSNNNCVETYTTVKIMSKGNSKTEAISNWLESVENLEKYIVENQGIDKIKLKEKTNEEAGLYIENVDKVDIDVTGIMNALKEALNQ